MLLKVIGSCGLYVNEIRKWVKIVKFSNKGEQLKASDHLK